MEILPNKIFCCYSRKFKQGSIALLAILSVQADKKVIKVPEDIDHIVYCKHNKARCMCKIICIYCNFGSVNSIYEMQRPVCDFRRVISYASPKLITITLSGNLCKTSYFRQKIICRNIMPLDMYKQWRLWDIHIFCVWWYFRFPVDLSGACYTMDEYLYPLKSWG